VYIYADHGQLPEQGNYVNSGLVRELEYCLEGFPQMAGRYPHKVVVIS